MGTLEKRGGAIMKDPVRVMRVLIYEGEHEWVEQTLAKGGVPINGSHTVRNKGYISSKIIPEFPKVLESHEAELLHHKVSTVGLWATDRPDVLTEEEKAKCYLFRIEDTTGRYPHDNS